MLVLKPNCEHCGKLLPNNSTEAMICSFECTFCDECVHIILENVCPNCGGNFQYRPIRPKSSLQKFPAENQAYIKPVDLESFAILKQKMKDTKPEKR